MAQELRAALLEDLAPSPNMAAHNHLYLQSQGSLLVPSVGLPDYQAQAHMELTPIHINIATFKEASSWGDGYSDKGTELRHSAS